MLARYVWSDLVRNPRRTLSTMIGVMLGVGLSCSVLFFVDGLSASMTQRAVAPLPIDMQRVLTVPIGGDVAGVAVGLVMAFYLTKVLRPLFLLTPSYRLPVGSAVAIVGSVLLATVVTSLAASSLVNRLRATELLRDE